MITKFRATEVETGSPLLWNAYFAVDNDGEVYRVAYDEGREVVSRQYTDLKDRNGVEIYEGDVVRASFIFDSSGEDAHDFENRAVTFEDGCFFIEPLPSIDPVTLQGLLDDPDFIGFEVIGDIYKNPDLLKAAS